MDRIRNPFNMQHQDLAVERREIADDIVRGVVPGGAVREAYSTYLLSRRNRYFFRMPPEAIEIVVLACLLGEDVDQKIAVVGQNPFRILVSLDAIRLLADGHELLADFVADGLNLARVGAGADHEIIGERRDRAQIEHAYVHGLARFGRAHGNQPGRRCVLWILRGGG